MILDNSIGQTVHWIGLMVEDSFDDILTWSDGNPLVIFCYLDLILTVHDIAKLYWDFRDALRRKSLCFSGIFYEFVIKNKKHYNFETTEGRNLKFTS